VAGCGNQGGSSDPYNTESGTITNMNYEQRSVTNDYQGSPLRPGDSDAGVIDSTNYPGFGTNDQGGATNSRALEDGQPFVPDRANNVAEN
jgi:hypothetical protein